MSNTNKFPRPAHSAVSEKEAEEMIHSAEEWANGRPRASMPLVAAIDAGLISEEMADALRSQGVSWIAPRKG